MKIKNITNKIAGAVLGLVLILGIGISSSTSARAQDRNNDQYRDNRNWDRYGNYGGSAELRQTALNAGYNEGVRQANDDRQNGRQANYQYSNVYRRATQDYNSRLGDRELYRRYFREGFESGYNSNDNGQGILIGNDRNRYPDRTNEDRNRYPDRNNNANQGRRGRNWDGYGNFGGSFQLRQTALNAGYNDGMKQGHNDRNRRNNGAGFQGQNAYQRATKDYSSRLGDREIYRRYYREAYENGYTDGINGY